MTLATTESDNNSSGSGAADSTNWLKGPALSAVAPGAMVQLDDGQDGIVIVNFQGELTAFRNACLHQGLPIHAGDLTKTGILLCPWHNWCYDVRDGACLTAKGAFLQKFPLRVEDGHIWVSKT